MKMVLVAEDEKDQQKEARQQEEEVMQSTEKVDENGHVIHRMDAKNNYLDDEGNVDMTAPPISIPLLLTLVLLVSYHLPLLLHAVCTQTPASTRSTLKSNLFFWLG